jgi:predicted dehydrogenase
MSEYKIAIVGAGHIAQEHLKVISAIPDMRVSLIFSRTKLKADSLAKKFSITTVAENFSDFLLNLQDIDGILNLVSAENIFEVTKQLLALRIPLFIEKPPALSFEETNELSELAKKYKSLNMVGFNRRFYSIYQKGIGKINENGSLLGVSIEGHERFWKIKDSLSKEIAEKWLFANSLHTIDLLNFFGGDIEKINSLSSSLKESHGDQFSLSIKFKSGALGNYSSHWYSPGGWSATLYGEGVTVIFKPLESGIWVDHNFKENKIFPEKYDIDFKEGFFQQMQCFKSCIENKQLEWPGVSLKESLKTLRLIKTMSIQENE